MTVMGTSTHETCDLSKNNEKSFIYFGMKKDESILLLLNQ